MNVAAGAEIAAGAPDHHRLDRIMMVEAIKGRPQLLVGFKGQRVLALGPVERDRGNAVGIIPEEMLGFEGRGVEAHALVPPSMVTAAPLMSRESGRHSMAMTLPMASGSTRRPLAFIFVIAERASPSLRPVISDTRATDWSVIGVST